MADMIASELGQAWEEFARAFAHLLPRLLAILIIALLGWVVAYLLRTVLRSFLRLVKFDRLSEKAGAAQLLNTAALPSPSELLSQLVFWLAWIGIVLAGVGFLGIPILQQHIGGFFYFLPRFFGALLIAFLGMLAAGFFARAALLAAVNADLPSPQILSDSVRVIIVVLTISMAFEELGLAQKTVLIAFSIVFGALMFGLAIAFGMGGRDLARHFLEKRFSDHQAQAKKGTDLPPL
jgi:Mechanosensitive ion channel, conserved TM helix